LKIQSERKFKEKLKEVPVIRGYALGESPECLARRLNLEPLKILKLNSSENFFIPQKKVVDIIKKVIEDFDPRVYPQEELEDFKNSLSRYLKVPSDHITIGNGGDQIIDLVTRLFLGKEDESLSIAPTFSMYCFSVKLSRSRYIEVPLKGDFSLDLEQFSNKITDKSKIIFICSPNNPTANQFKMEEIQSLIEGFEGLVFVDEAYVEFADYSFTRLVERFENLIVLRTFSKAFGLAGLRLGYAVSNPEIAEILSRSQLPYAVNSIALKAGLKMLEANDVVGRGIGDLKMERSRLVKRLNTIKGVTAFDSKTNFVLFQTQKPSTKICKSLADQGILVKDIGKVLNFSNCLRTTVGLPQMNNKLLIALRSGCQ
jgi:histidinol-phosphate aminotransferase